MATLTPVLVGASSNAGGGSGSTPWNAFDGNSGTFWSPVATVSPTTDDSWIEADFGAPATLSSVVITWGAQYATLYMIQISDDHTNWTTIYTDPAGNGGTDTISGLTQTARWVRLYIDTSTAVPIVTQITVDGTLGTSYVVAWSTATATSSFSGAFLPGNAVDSNLGTRWANDGSLPDTITFDLGSVKTITQFGVHFEDAYPISGTIETSSNGSSWSAVVTWSGTGTYPTYYWTPGSPASLRYVRITATTSSASGFFSVWEAKAFNTASGSLLDVGVDDTVAVTDTNTPGTNYVRTGSDTASVTDSIAAGRARDLFFSDTATVTDDSVRTAEFGRTPSDTLSVTDPLSIEVSKTLSDTISTTDSISASRARDLFLPVTSVTTVTF